MHWIRLVLFLLVPLLLALAGPLVLLWAWGTGKSLLPALLVGLVFLSTALVIFLVGQMAVPHEHEEDIALLWHEVETLHKKMRDMTAPAATSASGTDRQKDEDPASSPSSPRNGREPHAPDETAAAGMPPQPPQRDIAPAKPTPTKTDIAAAASRIPSSSSPAIVSAGNKAGFRLYMEPVTHLQENRVRMYRAHPALPEKGERVYLGRQAQLLARQRGEAAALQLFTLRRSMDFARQLQKRGVGLPIVCPVDVALLAIDEVARQLRDMLRTYHNANGEGGILLALTMADLEKSGREERRQALMLAQTVTGFVLDHAAMPTADAPLPLPLPVRYLDIPASALSLGGALSDWPQQRRRFQQRGMSLIASGVDTDAALEHARKMADLGRGMRFSPPRRVREELLDNASADQNAASGHTDINGQADHARARGWLGKVRGTAHAAR